MGKNAKKTVANPASGHFVKSDRMAKTAVGTTLTRRPDKAGKFSDGVKAVSRRDRTGLIKLADR